MGGFATFKHLLARIAERCRIHCEQLLQRSVFGSQPEELAFHGAIDELQFRMPRGHDGNIVVISVPYRAGDCTAVTQVESSGSRGQCFRHQESHHCGRNEFVKGCSKHWTRLPFAITIRTPSLDGLGLSADRLRLQGPGSVEEHL